MEEPTVVDAPDEPSRLPLQMGALFALLVVVTSSLTGIGVPVTIVRSLLAFVLGMGLGWALMRVLAYIQNSPPPNSEPAKTLQTETLPVAPPDEQDMENG